MKKLCFILILNSISTAVMAAVLVYEPFEGSVNTSFIGSTGGVGWSDAWVLVGDGSSDTALFDPFNAPYTDGSFYLTESGKAGLLKGNTGPVERPVAASSTNQFTQGETLWFSFRVQLERTDRQSSGISFYFDGGDFYVALESDPVADDNSGTIRVNSVDSSTVSPLFDTDFFLVGKVVFNDSGAETIRVWSNPTLDSVPVDSAALVATSTELGHSLTKVSLNSDGGATDFRFDELSMGDAFADAVKIQASLPPPNVISFSAEKPVIASGDIIELAWEVEDATAISITPSVGAGLTPSGYVNVTPIEDTEYSLIAENDEGSVTQVVSVAVMDVDFSVSPNVITNAGDSLMLSWAVSGADSVSIDQGIGSVGTSGAQSVSPASNTVFTLIASRPEGSVTNKAFAYSADQMPPNILFIAIDDLKRIGGYFSDDPGNLLPRIYPDPATRAEVISRLTPNIDSLASDGVAFMRAYCASPACNSSRAALMTGLYPHKTGLTANEGGIFFRDWVYGGERPMARSVTLTKHLMNNGYYAAGLGKIFHGPGFEETDGNKSWADWEIVSGTAGPTVDSIWANGGDPIGWGQEGGDSASYTNMVDYRRAEFLATVMETGSAGSFSLPQGKPFFLACGIQKPHLPYYATKDLADLFPVSEMTGVNRELYNEFFGDCGDLPEGGIGNSGAEYSGETLVLKSSERFVQILQNGLAIDSNDGDLQAWKDVLKYYLACSALADRSVGRLLEGLANSPYADNTLVILWSDHGYHLGEKMHISKFTLWEEGAGSHFIIRDPAYPSGHGIQCRRPVALTDIYPTVCSRLGIPLPDEQITGHDLSPLLENPRAPWNIPALCTFQGVDNNMVAMDRFKLIRYGSDPSNAELYDRDADPDEYNNLIDDPAYAAEQAEMFNLLDTAVAQGVFTNAGQWNIESWRHSYWNNSSDSGAGANSADPDGDGWDNFSEFSLLGDPLVSSPALSNAISFAIEGDEAAYRFPFRDAPGSIEYKVEETTDLMEGRSNLWHSASNSLENVTETDYGDGTYRLRVSVSTEPASRFMQLKISEPGAGSL